MTDDGRPVPEWLIERLAQGELPADAAAEVKARLGGAGEEALGRVAASNDEILRRLPPETVGPAIRRRLESARGVGRPGLGRALAFAVPAAAAGVLGLWLTQAGAPTGALTGAEGLAGAAGVAGASGAGGPGVVASAAEVTRDKGATRLLAYRQRGDARERLRDGAPARAHDRVQLAYFAGEDRFGAVVSVDGRGTVTRHLPATGATAFALEPGREARLQNSYELDDAPGFERFFLVTASEPFAVDEVLAAARDLARDPARARNAGLALRPGLSQHDLLLTKVQP